MRAVHFRQGSSGWHRWRSQGLGGSDAPTILGIDPYKDRSPRQLWLEKTGQALRPENTFAMRRGTRLEPVARAACQRATGLLVYPVCGEHDAMAWLRASLDGITFDGETIVEIKCLKISYHLQALDGEVPAHCYAQCQHQLLVSGAARCLYASYSEHSEVTEDKQLAPPIEVLPDREYQARLLLLAESFWEAVQTRTWPPKLFNGAVLEPVAPPA